MASASTPGTIISYKEVRNRFKRENNSENELEFKRKNILVIWL